MIIYNVTVQVQHDVAGEWVKWMKDEHMPELMQTGLFTDCRLCHLLDNDEADGPTYTAQYYCKSINEYNSYIESHAQHMREKGFARFGNRFIAFRTLMEVVA